MKMSWPTIWVIVIVLLIGGYFVGQGLHLDQKTAAAGTVAVSTQY
ncbi:MAG TPA: hypothetical protein VHX38_00690 [Pseudonocardiaceae bacterium]|jgi:hypothetical protein|nr:hypothetical protein [Pseudonocardiaceae bacterium]